MATSGQTTAALPSAAAEAEAAHNSSILSGLESAPSPVSALLQPPEYSFSLTKLACNGVIMLQHTIKKHAPSTAVKDTEQQQCELSAPASGMLSALAAQPVKVVQQILSDVEAGTLKAPQ